jgi:pimeloyl-ACP methyl ester carboxylesterase
MSLFSKKIIAPADSAPRIVRASASYPVQPMKTPPQTFVLIHGSWHGGWAWSAVKHSLEARGHRVYTPTLAGHDVQQPPKNITLEEVASSVVDCLETNYLDDVILVGWSFGGVVLQCVVERCPERISQMIFWDALVLQPGESLISIVEQWSPELIGIFGSLVDSQRNTIMLPLEMFATSFMPDAPLDTVRAIYRRLTPEPWGPINESHAFERFWSLVPMNPLGVSGPTRAIAYIDATEDNALGTGFWASQSAKLGPSCRHVILPVGAHEALFTQPEALTAAILLAAGMDTTQRRQHGGRKQ